MKRRHFNFLTILSLVILFIFTGCHEKAPIEEKVSKEKEKKEDKFFYVKRSIQPGESIYQVLTDAGISYKNCAKYVYELGQYVDYRSIQVGDSLIVKMEKVVKLDTIAVNDTLNKVLSDTSQVLRQIRYRPDIITNHILINENDSIRYEKDVLPYTAKKRIVTGELVNNLSYSLIQMGFNGRERQQIIKPLEALISFETDARKGDKFNFFIEEKFYNGEKLPFSKILYAAYEGKRVSHKEVFRFQGDREDSALNGMYSISGKRLAIGAVRTPLNYMHVTSPFGWRLHPIAGVRRLHKGTDYRARSPKPVYAVAKGRVRRAGRNGGNGIEIRIDHYDMMTHYAHLSRVYVRAGQKVRKGQKIGLTGNTGYSQAPHLHFGVNKRGKWVNPESNLRMVGAVKLKGKNLKEFKRQREMLLKEIKEIKTAQLKTKKGDSTNS